MHTAVNQAKQLCLQQSIKLSNYAYSSQSSYANMLTAVNQAMQLCLQHSIKLLKYFFLNFLRGKDFLFDVFHFEVESNIENATAHSYTKPTPRAAQRVREAAYTFLTLGTAHTIHQCM